MANPGIKISGLTTTAAAQLTDIIPAVQNSVTVQESLQQVANLILSQTILTYAGNPNGNVAGVVYQFCYDTTDKILYVCTTSGTASTAVWSVATTVNIETGTGLTGGPITSSGTISLITPVSLADGGTNNSSLTASMGGIVYSNATQLAILNGTTTANLPLLSGSTAAPIWGSFPLSLGGALTTAGTVTFSGAFEFTALITATTSVTFPTSGTLATTSQIPSGAALTAANDTNITLTLGGSSSTALINAASITAGWSGELSVTRGGTGLSSTTLNQLLYSSATNVISGLATPNSSALLSSGTGVLTWTTNTGTGNNVLATSPTIASPTMSSATHSNVSYFNTSMANSPTSYSTGTVSISSSNVIGVGTTFTPAMVGGVLVLANGVECFITIFNSTTSLNVQDSTTQGSQAYVIYYGGFQSNLNIALTAGWTGVNNLYFSGNGTASYVPAPLTYYEETLLTGTWALGATTVSGNVYIRRIGKMVSLSFTEISMTPATSTTPLTFSVSLPARFDPINAFFFSPVYGTISGTASWMVFEINGSSGIQITQLSNAAFGTAAITVFQGSVTWVTL